MWPPTDLALWGLKLMHQLVEETAFIVDFGKNTASLNSFLHRDRSTVACMRGACIYMRNMVDVRSFKSRIELRAG